MPIREWPPGDFAKCAYCGDWFNMATDEHLDSDNDDHFPEYGDGVGEPKEHDDDPVVPKVRSIG